MIILYLMFLTFIAHISFTSNKYVFYSGFYSKSSGYHLFHKYASDSTMSFRYICSNKVLMLNVQFRRNNSNNGIWTEKINWIIYGIVFDLNLLFWDLKWSLFCLFWNWPFAMSIKVRLFISSITALKVIRANRTI